jgi:predicted DNA-binding protein
VKHGLPQNVEIFAFGDAFKQAYALVIYIVATHNDGSKMSHLAFAKTRVAPLKMVQLGENQQTIVRLELLAALITARSACYVQEAIERTVKVTKITFFTDSLISVEFGRVHQSIDFGWQTEWRKF